MYHISDWFVQVPLCYWWEAENKNTYNVYGWGDACMWIMQYATDEAGVHWENRFAHLQIVDNVINCSAWTYKVYGIRIYGAFKRYWMSNFRIRGNSVYGGWYQIHCSGSTDHSSQCNWNSFYDNNMMHNYAYTWLGGAWQGSATDYGWNRYYEHGTYTGSTNDGGQ
jgi:hypothetical protein